MRQVNNEITHYAKKADCPIEVAVRRVKCFAEIDNRITQAKICPLCGMPTLYIDSSGTDYTCDEWVACENSKVPTQINGETIYSSCNFTSEVTEQFTPITFMYGWDDVLIQRENGSTDTSWLGMTWERFVLENTERLEKDLGITSQSKGVSAKWNSECGENLPSNPTIVESGVHLKIKPVSPKRSLLPPLIVLTTYVSTIFKGGFGT